MKNGTLDNLSVSTPAESEFSVTPSQAVPDDVTGSGRSASTGSSSTSRGRSASTGSSTRHRNAELRRRIRELGNQIEQQEARNQSTENAAPRQLVLPNEVRVDDGEEEEARSEEQLSTVGGRSRSTSSSTRRENEDLHRIVQELESLAFRGGVPDVIEIQEVAAEDDAYSAASDGSASTSSSTRRQNEELRRRIRELEIENDQMQGRLSACAKRLDGYHEGCISRHVASQIGHQPPLVYARQIDEEETQMMVQAKAVAVEEGNAVNWRKWLIIGGLAVLVVVVGGVCFYVAYLPAAGAGAAAGSGAAAVGATEATTAGAAALGASEVAGGAAVASAPAAAEATSGVIAGVAAALGATIRRVSRRRRNE